MIDGKRRIGWLFLVEYGQEQKSGGQYQPKIDWREQLNSQEFALFDTLRALSDLKRIPGIGESKVRQFGEEFFEAFRTPGE